MDIREAYTEFRQNYVMTHRPPQKPSITQGQALGWIFWANAITCAAAVLLAAFRTGSWFYMAAASDKMGLLGPFASKSIGVVEAILGILAYEGLLVVIAITNGIRRKHPPKIASYIVVSLGLFTSFVAGLGTSFNLLPEQYNNVANILLLVLVVSLGLATAMAWFAGDLLGYQYKLAQEKLSAEYERYNKELSAYEVSMRRSWEAYLRKISGKQTQPQLVAPQGNDNQSHSISKAVLEWIDENNLSPFTVKPSVIVSGLAKKGIIVNDNAVRVALHRIRNNGNGKHLE